jgi:hypothetical protein
MDDHEPRYGDNIYEIGDACGRCLAQAGWARVTIDGIHQKARDAGSYDGAIAVYRRYITIRDK